MCDHLLTYAGMGIFNGAAYCSPTAFKERKRSRRFSSTVWRRGLRSHNSPPDVFQAMVLKNQLAGKDDRNVIARITADRSQKRVVVLLDKGMSV